MTVAGIGLIGSGNIGAAFVKGWIRSAPAMSGRITVADARPEAAEKLAGETGTAVAGSNQELVEKSDLVLLAVKPGDVEAALKDTLPRFSREKALVSVAAGRTIAFLEALFPQEVPVFRLMPNLAIEVGAGTIAFAAGHNVDKEFKDEVAGLISMLGRVVPLEEKFFAAATAIGGSGPGFLALIMESFIDAGVLAGLPAAAARELSGSMLAGTAELIGGAGLGPAALRRRITSPAGTTAAGLAVLERHGARAAIIEAVQAAAGRAREMG